MENTNPPAQVDAPAFNPAQVDAIISRFFVIESIRTGKDKEDALVRYCGRLRSEDSEKAYDELAAALEPLHLTPLFRWEGDQHAIHVVESKPKPPPSNPVVNLVLFIITLFSVIFVGGSNVLAQEPTGNFLSTAAAVIREGIPFAVAILSILLAHEFGHYLMCRKYGVDATLPYFLPMPIMVFGTMGAFIQMKEMPKNRRHLLDIGLAGPLAGLAVAIPVLILGLSLSKVEPLPLQVAAGSALQLEGNSILYLFLKYAMFGQLLPAPASYGNLPQWLYWLQFFFTGRPIPLGGTDVLLHSIAWAGWGGLLITSLNLIPAGQLDGGHVVYTLFGRKKALRILPYILVGLAILSVFSLSWLLWLLIIYFLGRTYAEPLDQITELNPGRRRLAVFALIVFVLVFIPIPLNIIM